MSQANVELLRAYHDELARASQKDLDFNATISKMADFWWREALGSVRSV